MVTHLLQYKAPNVVSIGEDATRLISRVEWDPESNRCCGFVLPINEKGLPDVDSFLALTFEGMEEMFIDNQISKYAYVYMVQPLMVDCPSFCLMIIGTDNKFTAKSDFGGSTYLESAASEEFMFLALAVMVTLVC